MSENLQKCSLMSKNIQKYSFAIKNNVESVLLGALTYVKCPVRSQKHLRRCPHRSQIMQKCSLWCKNMKENVLMEAISCESAVLWAKISPGGQIKQKYPRKNKNMWESVLLWVKLCRSALLGAKICKNALFGAKTCKSSLTWAKTCKSALFWMQKHGWKCLFWIKNLHLRSQNMQKYPLEIKNNYKSVLLGALTVWSALLGTKTW